MCIFGGVRKQDFIATGMKTRKELKNEYKQRKSVMGVFQIRNTVNDKRLIDHSTDIQAKWNRHQSELRFGSHKNKALQADWKKLGTDSFQIEILSELEHDDKITDYSKELELLEEMILNESDFSEGQLYLK